MTAKPKKTSQKKAQKKPKPIKFPHQRQRFHEMMESENITPKDINMLLERNQDTTGDGYDWSAGKKRPAERWWPQLFAMGLAKDAFDEPSKAEVVAFAPKSDAPMQKRNDTKRLAVVTSARKAKMTAIKAERLLRAESNEREALLWEEYWPLRNEELALKGLK